jgi:hypothetical protein
MIPVQSQLIFGVCAETVADATQTQLTIPRTRRRFLIGRKLSLLLNEVTDILTAAAANGPTGQWFSWLTDQLDV